MKMSALTSLALKAERKMIVVMNVNDKKVIQDAIKAHYYTVCKSGDRHLYSDDYKEMVTFTYTEYMAMINGEI